MKKKNWYLPFMAICLGLSSCREEVKEDIRYEINSVKIDSVEITTPQMTVGEFQTIYLYSTYEKSCNSFGKVDYVKVPNSLERKVAIAVMKDLQKECGPLHTFRHQFNFEAKTPGTYTFRFWNGGDNWIEKNIVVN